MYMVVFSLTTFNSLASSINWKDHEQDSAQNFRSLPQSGRIQSERRRSESRGSRDERRARSPGKVQSAFTAAKAVTRSLAVR